MIDHLRLKFLMLYNWLELHRKVLSPPPPPKLERQGTKKNFTTQFSASLQTAAFERSNSKINTCVKTVSVLKIVQPLCSEGAA